jgi:LuxR family transcriptional regulator, maltose regulon positive regulatory protein
VEQPAANPPLPPAVLAKVRQPRLPACYPRERLFQRLDELADRPCVWIGAPAGYGKTTLAASYAEARGIPSLWYQFDEDDADLATFFYYLGIAVGGRDPDPPLPLPSPTYQDDLPALIRRYARTLGSRLRSPFLLLFDDYPAVLPAAAPLHAALAEILAQLPDGVRCVVTSRGEPPPALARAHLYGQLVTLGVEALRLTLPEAEGLAEMQPDRRLTAAEVRPLHEWAQGWVAGLTLLLRGARPCQTRPSLKDVEPVFDYFATEVWCQTDPALQTFLRKTALLPKMTAAMADRLTGGDQGEAVLNGLVRRHCFTFQGEAADPEAAVQIRVFQYHQMFREFLLKEGREQFSAAERAQDQHRAAVLLEAAGEFSAAVELWQALGDWEALGRLVEHQASVLLHQGRGQILEAWLAYFPPVVRENSPWLLFWEGQCQLLRDPVAARTTLVRAYRRFKRGGEVAGLWLAWSAIVETYGLAWDNFKAAGAWLVEFERLRIRYPRFPSRALETRVACGVFSLMVLTRPEHPEFAEWERRILRLLQADCPPDLYLHSLNVLLFHYIYNVGHRGRSAWTLAILRATRGDVIRVDPLLRCAWQCWQFCYQYSFEGDLQYCLALAEAARTDTVEQGIGFFRGFALANCVHADLSAGRLREGRAALAQFEAMLPALRPLEQTDYFLLRGWEAWLSGREVEAVEMLEQALWGSRRLFHQATGIAHLGLAQARASLGQRAEALRHLAGLRPWIRATHSRIGTFLRALAAAQFALAWGREPRGLRLLRRALALGRAEGYIFFPFFKSTAVARLCATALDADIEVEYARTLIDRRGLSPDPDTPPAERWPWPVRIYTLGRFALEVDGQPVTFSRKAQHKPLELLKVLIALGGREVSQTRVADALWPEADGDAARQALATTLHRLRRLLGHDAALLLREGRLSLNPRYCWVDVWHLEHCIAQTRARRANGAPAPAALTAQTHALLGAYDGPFLGPDADAWAHPVRDRLRDRYLKALEEVGGYWEKLGHGEMARFCHERAVEVTTVLESAQRFVG